MKTVALAALLLVFTAYVTAQQYYCYPSSVQSANNLYVAFDTNAYKYSIPDLNLQVSKSYNNLHLCAPASLNNNLVTFAGSYSNTNSTNLNTADLTVASQSNSAAPYPSTYPTDCVSMDGFNYCFVNANNQSFIQRRSGNNVVESLQLPIADKQAQFITTDADVAGRIHVATKTCQYRGCTQLQYYALAVNPLRIIRGPVALPNTVGSGCPVEPSGCAVPVVVSGPYVRNDIVTYVWSIQQDGYKVNVVTYDARCDSTKTVALGQSLAAAARCSGQTTSAPTRNCWTCPAGYVHWYDVPGQAEPADKCACMIMPSSTSQPTRNCWTCPAGYVHWYDIPGQAEPADKCACMIRPTQAPSTSQPTRNCWTCPAGYVHWYDVPGTPEPADKCACMLRPTQAPSTSQPTRNCWTCPAGYVHWYDVPGTPEPADKCACMLRPTQAPSTSAPTRNCWTCPAGYVHWYDIPGQAEPADKCACMLRPATRNCWTCPAGFVHWYDIAGYPEPADKCACVRAN